MRGRIIVGALVAVAALMASTGTGGAANNSEQVVFSGVGQTDVGPFGNWIWCEADSQNPYAGACQGSIYFYALGLTKHVSGFVTEPEEGRYVMHVGSRDGSIQCDLSNTDDPVSGPHNTVDISCSAPATTGSSDTEVVRVTGP